MVNYSEVFMSPAWKAGNFLIEPKGFSDTGGGGTGAISLVPNTPNNLGIFGKKYTMCLDLGMRGRNTWLMGGMEPTLGTIGYTVPNNVWSYSGYRQPYNINLQSSFSNQAKVQEDWDKWVNVFGAPFNSEKINEIWKDFDYTWVHNPSVEHLKPLFETKMGDKTTYLILGNGGYGSDPCNIVIKMINGTTEAFVVWPKNDGQRYNNERHMTPMDPLWTEGNVMNMSKIAMSYAGARGNLQEATGLPKWLPSILPNCIAEAQIKTLDDLMTQSNVKVFPLEASEWGPQRILEVMQEIAEFGNWQYVGDEPWDVPNKPKYYALNQMCVLTNGGPPNFNGRLGEQSQLLYAWNEKEIFDWFGSQPKSSKLLKAAKKTLKNDGIEYLRRMFYQTFMRDFLKTVDDSTVPATAKNDNAPLSDKGSGLLGGIFGSKEMWGQYENDDVYYHRDKLPSFNNNYANNSIRFGSQNIPNKTVAEIKPMLKERGLKVSGNKDAIVQRLRDYKINTEYPETIVLDPVSPEFAKVSFSNFHIAALPNRLM